MDAFSILVYVPIGALGYDSKYFLAYKWWSRRRNLIQKLSSCLFVVEANGYGLWLIRRLEALIGVENVYWYPVRSRGVREMIPQVVNRLAEKRKLSAEETQLLSEITVQID